MSLSEAVFLKRSLVSNGLNGTPGPYEGKMFSWVGLQMKLSFVSYLDANMIKWCTGPGWNRVMIKSSLNIVDIHDTKN